MHTTSRSVVAAARAHPAGVAAPSAVIATAIVLLTFVTTVIVPSLPPGLFGAGSAPAIQPGPSQQRHRVLPQHPVPTGPPILPVLPGALGRGAPGAASGTVQAASSTLQGASQAHGNTSQGGSAVDSVQQALPAAGSLPGVG